MERMLKNPFRRCCNTTAVLLALAGLALCLQLVGCAASRVDPISPDIQGVHVTPPAGIASERYYYERHDPQTDKWYEARELIPGFGLMVYTHEGMQELRHEREKDIK